MPLSVLDSSGTAVTTGVPSGSVFYYAGSNLAPVATPTDVIRIGASSTKTTYIHSIRVTGAATAAGSMIVVIAKRSTAGTTTSATLSDVTPCPAVTGDTSTATVKVVSVANVDAQGTLVGNLAAGRVNCVAIGSAATSGAGETFVFKPVKPVALAAGTTQYVTIEGGGSGIPSGGKWDWELVTEEV